jgi:hypothetical protein
MAEYAREHGGSPPGKAVVAGPASGDPLERRAAAIEQRVHQLQHAQAVGRWQMIITALIVIGLFAVFAITTTRRVKENLQEDRLREAVAKRVPDVRPDFERHLTDVARDVIPVYREQAVARFRQVGPEVANEAIQRLKALPESSSRKLEGQLTASHNRVLARIEPEIATRYPSLSDARKRELLASYFHERIDAENKQLATKMESLHTSEAIRVQAVLEKFGVGEAPPARPGEREREFLHALVDVMMDSDLTGAIIPPAPGTIVRPTVAAGALIGPREPAEPAASTQPAGQ